jgi:restriction endonuclease S subunit
MGSEPPADWDEVRLGDCGRWLSGGTPSTKNPDFWDGDIPWISGKSLTTHYLRDSDRRVTALGAANGTRIAPRGATLMVVRGMSLQTEFRSGIAMRDLAFGQDCKAIIPRAGVEPHFLANAVRARAPEILGMVDSSSHGTGRLATELIQALRIGLPPMEEQRAIAEVLGALDDRIDWCRATQRLLRATLHARFQSEFRVGEPVRLGDVTETVPGRSYKSAELDEASPVGLVNLKNIPRHGGFNPAGVKGYTGPYRQQQVVQPGELVVACTDMTQQGDVIGRSGRVRPNPTYPTMVISMDMAAIRPTVPWLSTEFLTEVLNTRDYVDHMKRYVNGTTVLHLKKVALAEYETVMPTPEVIATFTEFAQPMWARHDVLDDEAHALTRLRDSLLPRLLSGELQIEDPERVLGAVA